MDQVTKGWNKSDINVFWGEIAPCDHLVQIYENDKSFLDTLEGFVAGGFVAGDGVILIATQNHLDVINHSLLGRGFDLEQLRSDDKYIPLDAHRVLEEFIVNEWPDELLFNTCIDEVIKRASANGRKVRAFGEMVAVLWARGQNGATVQLENLWNNLHTKEKFSLYCAYPKSGFTQNANDSIHDICCAHSKIIHGSASGASEIYYRESSS